MKIIGLAGLARSGKDTIAHHLSHYGYHDVAFADPLRAILRDVLNVPDQYMNVVKEVPIPPHGHSYRKLMQTFGDAGRNLATNFWIQALEREIKEYADDMTHIVVTDVRYLNEAFWVRHHGSLWHVRRPGQDPVATRPHSSEEGVDPLPGEPILINDGDIHHLLDQVDQLMHPLTGSEQA